MDKFNETAKETLNDEQIDHQDFLKEEYFAIQHMIEEYDQRALTIKAWSVTLSAAAIVTAYIKLQSEVLLIAAGSAVVFWIVEALWKINQQAFYPRTKEIERYFARSNTGLPPLQIATSWSEAFWRDRRDSRLLGWIPSHYQAMLWPHVYMPHLIVAAAGVLLYILAPPAATTVG